MKKWVAAILVIVSGIAAFAFLRRGEPWEDIRDPEARIVAYLQANVRPGQPVIVTDLFNDVFTTREEQRVLQRLFNTFFKIPAAAAQIQAQTGRLPTVQELSEQFAFKVPGEMDIFLKVMDADPRMPRVLDRDPATGEITNIHIPVIAEAPRFSQIYQQTTKRWIGEPAPALPGQSLSGTPHLVYFFFTDCPPCMRTAPLLIELHRRYAAEGFQIVAANAGVAAELDTGNSIDTPFIETQVSQEVYRAYGSPIVYPALFFVNRDGRVASHLVSFQQEQALEEGIQSALMVPQR